MNLRPLSKAVRSCIVASLTSALVLSAGCGHVEARCAYRPRSPEQAPVGASAAERDWYQRREAALREGHERYERGMERFRRSAPEGQRIDRGDSEFGGVYDGLQYYWGGGEFLFEPLEDGHWAYRCDETSRLFALAKYRGATILVDDWGDALDQWSRSYAERLMCSAIQARAEVVLDTVKREGISPKARRMLDVTLADPACNVSHGWRTSYTGAFRPDEGVRALEQ